jgi:hypothetical protein
MTFEGGNYSKKVEAAKSFSQARRWTTSRTTAKLFFLSFLRFFTLLLLYSLIWIAVRSGHRSLKQQDRALAIVGGFNASGSI